jgi:orotidine-5'-phosphate decarboxylase
MKRDEIIRKIVVALDFDFPDGYWGPSFVMNLVQDFAGQINGIPVCLKVGTDLRVAGHELIKQIHDYGFRVFADFKLYDIPSTLRRDGRYLKFYRPEFLTVSLFSPVDALIALKAELPDTKVLGVTTLTSSDDLELFDTTKRSLLTTTMSLIPRAKKAGLDGVVCAAASVELETVKRILHGTNLLTVTPNIRSEGVVIIGDDQNNRRTSTPVEALKRGADYIVLGRQITQAKDPRQALVSLIDEIEGKMNQ